MEISKMPWYEHSITRSAWESMKQINAGLAMLPKEKYAEAFDLLFCGAYKAQSSETKAAAMSAWIRGMGNGIRQMQEKINAGWMSVFEDATPEDDVCRMCTPGKRSPDHSPQGQEEKRKNHQARQPISQDMQPARRTKTDKEQERSAETPGNHPDIEET